MSSRMFVWVRVPMIILLLVLMPLAGGVQAGNGTMPGQRPTPVRPTPRATAARPTRVAPAVATPRPAVPTVAVPTAAVLTPVPAYQGAEMISSFAASYLGLGVSVGRVYAAGANLKLPAPVQADVNMAVQVAGQAAAGAITAGAAKGLAEVAVGQGQVSGDLAADISGASLGAFSLVVPATVGDSAAALALIRSTYPGLAAVSLQPASAAGVPGYVFEASAVHPGIDPGTRQATAVVEEILAGVYAQGGTAVVWAVIGNGTLAANVDMP